MGGSGSRIFAKSNASNLEDFYSWGELVLAPHESEIVAETNHLPDNPIGIKDTTNPAGNYETIKIAPDSFLLLAHLRQGTNTVKLGERIKRGQALGECGNSGNSEYPHVHIHLQNQSEPNEGEGQNLVLSGANTVMNGKRFEKVT